MITNDYGKAEELLFEFGHGIILKKDGAETSGTLRDMQSPINDPDGIGFLLIKQKESGKMAIVYENEFAGLVEVW